ncbi:tetrapyrrole biosynthesis, uroporphyrinogen III synthase [Crassisporium funariophilum]|nr:tetrapyrrole biosynthesis, uroporphyrinogen III synthase [Crassisporium funariophilum]
MANVLLLREPSGTCDRYESAFTLAGYHPISIAVLETSYTNLSSLRDIIQQGPKVHGYSGVVVTSKRSCDAWREALQLLTESVPEGLGVGEWYAVPFYVVGQGTESALRDAFHCFQHLGLTSVDVRGQSSGSAASLAPMILQDFRDRPGKLLYLTGDKNRDTLPRLLNEGGVELEPIQVYKTEGSTSFASALSAAIASSPKAKDAFWWIVYFAPSAAAFVSPILTNYFELKTVESQQQFPGLMPAKIAAIGPTTYSFLQDGLRLMVDVTAEKPSPEDIVSSIVEYDLAPG